MKLKSAISPTFTFIMCMFRFIEGIENKPNIIFILADDLGWNDVGFHGSSEIPTPNIDSLAYSGIILNNYYVNPICTPSRSALMTGKYPIHNGMQHDVLLGEEPRGLPLTEILLPQYLKKLGYRNHIVGKWHLGFYKKEYTPTFRGFDSHLGYWTGHQDYYDHTAAETHVWGLDMRKNMDVVEDLHGQYSTDVFTKEAIRIIRNQNKSEPLYLHVAHAAVHSANEYNPLPAPDDYVAKFAYIKDYKRQRFAGMLTKLDESVGEIVGALKDEGMLENSIIIFSTDNGGPAAGFNYNAASNFPLRGVKNTLWEGGVRGVGFLWSPHLKFSSRVAKQRMHITDWLPTLMEAVDGNFSKRDLIDGISMWKSLSENVESERLDVLHDIDDIIGRASITVGNWKYIKGTSYNGDWDGWYGPSGREYKYNFTLIAHSPAYSALKSIGKSVSFGKMEELRLQSTLTCNQTEVIPCRSAESPCLFNLGIDPCESNNLAATYPNVLKTIEEILLRYNKTAIPPGNLPLDLRGNPRYWNYAWTNFGDYL